MKKVKFITAIYNNLFGTEFGGRQSRRDHYKWSLISIMRMTDSDFTCYCSKSEYQELHDFFYVKNNISQNQLELKQFELSNNLNFNYIENYKNFEEIKKSDRCFEIQYNKFFWLLNEDFSYDYYFWIDAGFCHCGLLPDKYLTYCDVTRGYFDSYFFDNEFLQKMIDKTGEQITIFTKDNLRNYWSDTVPQNYYNQYDSTLHVIGGLFGGKKEIMKWYVNEFQHSLKKITEETKRLYSEEHYMSLIYVNNRDKFKTYTFDIWWHETNGPNGLADNYFVINKSFYKSLEDIKL